MSNLDSLISEAAPSERVQVQYTRNRRIVLSLRRRNGACTFRAHEIFRDAPEEVLRAVVRSYFTLTRRDTRRRLGKIIRTYINRCESRIEESATSKPRKLAVYGHRGRHYDLLEVFDGLNAEFFGGRVKARLTWSREINRRKLGTWRPIPGSDIGLIRINRLFDDPAVPLYYVRQLVLHEMLHGVFENRNAGARTIRHTREFRAFERRSPMYEKAKQWEKENLAALYRKRTKENSHG